MKSEAHNQGVQRRNTRPRLLLCLTLGGVRRTNDGQEEIDAYHVGATIIGSIGTACPTASRCQEPAYAEKDAVAQAVLHCEDFGQEPHRIGIGSRDRTGAVKVTRIG